MADETPNESAQSHRPSEVSDNHRQRYERPTLIAHGALRDFTLTVNNKGKNGDGATKGNDKTG